MADLKRLRSHAIVLEDSSRKLSKKSKVHQAKTRKAINLSAQSEENNHSKIKRSTLNLKRNVSPLTINKESRVLRERNNSNTSTKFHLNSKQKVLKENITKSQEKNGAIEVKFRKAIKNLCYNSELNLLGNIESTKTLVKNENHSINKKIDVYDIALDEELSAEVTVPVKRKKIRPKKCNGVKKFKRQVLKENMVPVKNFIRLKNNQTDLKFLSVTEKVMKTVPAATLYNTEEKVKSLDQIPSVQSDLESIEEIDHSDIEVVIKTEQTMDFELQSTKSYCVDNALFLSHLADELEKSFSCPKMTSTPTEITPKPQNPQDVSCIMPAKDIQKEITTPFICSDKKDKDLEITLFESPVKEQKPLKQGVIKFKSPQKHIKINLFSDNSELLKEQEKSVLKPRKAYNTPDLFKTRLAKARRPGAAEKIVEAKSKQAVLIERLSQHFDEIGETELCIE